ncbi:uncharacterized protein UV8b_05924 [Ustilaginoidea virens]|uniref:Uncharacterized protein n=1 Tax=Ustilaginoidea virens TaxID=1159556 RepID=A0A8E5MJD6_USTVR|nr:uncharacterized protein UV8b_05924 [Ustilaginoidea virens]QUC21681.1 hypothetical protein UV8b_05924 [Ustilaginoidea virens]
MNLRHALVVLGAARTMAADETKPAWRPAGVVALIGIDGDKWWSGHCRFTTGDCLYNPPTGRVNLELVKDPLPRKEQYLTPAGCDEESPCDEDEQPCLVHQASLKAYCRLSSEPYFYWMRPTVEPNE